MTGFPIDSLGWIDTETPLFTRRIQPKKNAVRHDLGVVVVPGFGYVELVARDGWVFMAHLLADAGFPTILLDLPGTGSSGDIPSDSSWIKSWVGAVRHAVCAVETSKVVLIGARVGALVASAALQQADIDEQVESLVLWSPTPSGRQFKRELSLLAASPPGSVQPDGVTFGGFLHSAALLDELGTLTLRPMSARGRTMMIIEDSQRPEPTKAVAVFEDLGWSVKTVRSSETRAWLDASAELATPPSADGQLLVGHLQSVAASMSQFMTPTASGDIASHHGANSTIGLSEEVQALGPPGLAAVFHHPPTQPDAALGVMLLNSGVERAWGPGRAWVDAARRWSAAGITVARIEHASTGDSGTWPGQERHDVYGSHGSVDIALGLEAMASRGADRVVAAGLCSSAFTLLQAGPDQRMAVAVAINPQLYRIGTAAGVIEEETNHVRYWIARVDQVIGLRRTLNAVKRLLGRYHPAFEWIEAFVGSSTRLVLVFGSDDRGLRFLQREGAGKLASLQRAGVELVVIDGLDHALHSGVHRAQVMAVLDRLLADVCPPPEC